jgi:hypothetical protein
VFEARLLSYSFVTVPQMNMVLRNLNNTTVYIENTNFRTFFISLQCGTTSVKFHNSICRRAHTEVQDESIY